MNYSEALKQNQMNPLDMMNQMMVQFRVLSSEVATLRKENADLKKERDNDSIASGNVDFNVLPMLMTLLTKVKPSGGDKVAQQLLKAVAFSCPDRFKQSEGGIHHDPTGTRTYVSVRLYNDEADTHWINLHVYLRLRGTRKIVAIEVYSYDNTSVIEYNPDYARDYVAE
jgi:hypothetical protein